MTATRSHWLNSGLRWTVSSTPELLTPKPPTAAFFMPTRRPVDMAGRRGLFEGDSHGYLLSR